MHETTIGFLAVILIVASCMPASPPTTNDVRQRATPAPVSTSPVDCEPATVLSPDSSDEEFGYHQHPVWRERSVSRQETPTTYAEPATKPIFGEYTDSAMRSRVSGIVILEVGVRSDGEVVGARVVKGLPCGLEEKALQAVEATAFKPARIGTRAIDSVIHVTVNFRLPVEPAPAN